MLVKGATAVSLDISRASYVQPKQFALCLPTDTEPLNSEVAIDSCILSIEC